MKPDVNVPRWLLQVLRWLCPAHLLEVIEGDVIEQFHKDVVRVGKSRACLRAAIHTFDFIRVGIISRHRIRYTMEPLFSHFFKFCFRGMKKNPGLSFTSIFGLSLGLATALLILIYVNDERSYDKFYKDAVRIYRVVCTIDMGGQVMHTAFSPNALPDAVTHGYPQVEYIARAALSGKDKTIASRDREVFATELSADASFFKIFSYQFVEGDPNDPLPDKECVVLTRSVALKLFGESQNIVGRFLRNGQHVSGVIEDVPANTHLRFDYVSRIFENGSAWNNFGSYHYLKFKDPSKATEIERSLNEVLISNLSKDPHTAGFKGALRLQPLTEIHLDEVTYSMEPEGKGNRQYLVIFTLLAIFILAIGCINFTNLTTVRGIRRAKEIGLRKTIGAFRLQLVAQLLGESLLAVTVAMVFSVLIAALVLEPFNALVGKNLSFDLQTFGIPMFISFGVMIVAGILSGIYPAAILSSVRPSLLIKGAHGTNLSGGTLSRSLIIVQFIFSILIISGTLVIYDQLHYIRKKNLGYQRENILRIHDWSNDYATFKSELLQQHGIGSMCGLDQDLTRVVGGGGIDWPGRSTKGVPVVTTLFADADFLKTLKISLTQGRDFYRDGDPDSGMVLANEEAVKLLGVSDPLGLRIEGIKKGGVKVIGIVKDFHFKSIHEKVGPLFITQANAGNPYSNTLIRMDGDPKENIEAIGKAWKKFNPGEPFVYSFLDDDFQAVYRAEEVTETLFKIFGAIGIVTACLGLLSLSAYTAETKRKEYSIRKIFGASPGNLFYSSTIDHLNLVLIAAVISAPVGYYFADKWLSSFAYHTSPSLLPFFTGGILAALLAFITVGSQAAKIVFRRPSVTLRSE
jgi:ABC-type antimicrobial peptide transport system permease subunit